MGIPSYFSYIVKNHKEIIKLYRPGQLTVNNLYLDSNSIIYDAVRTMNIEDITLPMTVSIIAEVIIKIEQYIEQIQPTESVMIAFDGVAPVAKMEQQRSRRYKSWYISEISNTKSGKNRRVDAFNTTAITPGTQFMKELNDRIKKHFVERYSINVIVSGSDEPGEGEHKIFGHIRSHPEEHRIATTVIYGLDADLIMLSINHLPISRNIYLFRETPEFIKCIDDSLLPNELYVLDIPALSDVITLDMCDGKESQINRIYDYIFMCFFLGNDFMPHFPSINIRTGGITKLVDAYKATIGLSQRKVLTDGKIIYWKNVNEFVSYLAAREEQYMKAEMKLRDRRSKYPMSADSTDDTLEEKMRKFDALPSYEREVEKYIDPYRPGWNERYYKGLFPTKVNEQMRLDVCLNYLEGLEWTMMYYTKGCSNWRWKYDHYYPPLLTDLIKVIPNKPKTFFVSEPDAPVSMMVQLCYVLPYNSLNLLPLPLYNKVVTTNRQMYPVNCNFRWSFCKYFWEAHVELPKVDVNDIELLVGDVNYDTI